MTRDEALRRATEGFDRLYERSIRRLVTALVTAERPDDEIDWLTGLAYEEWNAHREAYVEQVTADIDEHFPPPMTAH